LVTRSGERLQRIASIGKNMRISSVRRLPVVCFFSVGLFAGLPAVQARAGESSPLRTVVDLDIGEALAVEVSPGLKIRVVLDGVTEERDRFRKVVRATEVKLTLDGKPVRLRCANYQLPVTVGRVQIDCPVTRVYFAAAGPAPAKGNAWALQKAARLRFWAAGAPLLPAGTFDYPVRQRFFATHTQMANEPTYVNGGEFISGEAAYYHVGLDIGGAEGLVDALAIDDAVAVSVANKGTEGVDLGAVRPREDVVYLRDGRGWYYRYSHLQSIDHAVTVGARIRRGQKIGVLGKEGGSGGWAHLHFEIVAKQPSGKWGIEEGFAYLLEAYRREQGIALKAIARPHAFIAAGDEVTLDGSRSWLGPGKRARYRWTLSDGTRAVGAQVKRRYPRPGFFSEILELSDGAGHTDIDFAVVEVLDPGRSDRPVPSIHAAYAPSLKLTPGMPISFLARAFMIDPGTAVWNFGDGSAEVSVATDGNREIHAKDGYSVVKHSFSRPGSYLVRVSQKNGDGWESTARLYVQVGR
jgi:hypothetical protein